VLYVKESRRVFPIRIPMTAQHSVDVLFQSEHKRRCLVTSVSTVGAVVVSCCQTSVIFDRALIISVEAKILSKAAASVTLSAGC